jgi:transposase
LNETQKQQLQTFITKAKEGAASRRALAVRLLDAGLDVTMTGYTKKHAERLRRGFTKHGSTVFEDHRKNNRDRVLTASEKKQVIVTLKTKQPKDVISGCEVEHWTTNLLGLYVFEQFGKRYKSKTSERLLFREANFTWHCPGKAYEKADPEAKEAWIKQTKPLLTKHWADTNAVILCEDEMVLTSRTTVQKVWLPKGEYPPVVETNSTRRRKNFYGFLNLKTGEEHAYLTDKQNMGVTAEILERVRKLYRGRLLVIIWDNCGWHRGSKVTEWIAADGNTETIHFPPYTPQLNPQEHVWKAGRSHVTHNQYIGEHLEEIASKFEQYITGRTFAYELLGLKSGVAQY